MHEQASEIDSVIQHAEQMATQALGDRDLSEAKRGELARRLRTEGRQQAQTMAQDALEDAAGAVEKASGRVVKLRQEHAGAHDYSRQQVANQAAAGLAQRDWNDVVGAIDDAVSVGDVYRLQAFADVAMPALTQRAHAAEAGQWRGRGGEIESLGTRVKDALGALEPAELKAAREKLAAAQQNEVELNRGLSSVNWRHSRSGGPGPLAPTGEVEVVQHPRDGRLKLQVEGGSWI